MQKLTVLFVKNPATYHLLEIVVLFVLNGTPVFEACKLIESV